MRQIVLLPADLSQNADLAVETRRRGIFDTPVWRGAADVKARFPPTDRDNLDPAIVAARWDDAAVALHVADPHWLKREIVARVAGHGAPLDIGCHPFAANRPCCSRASRPSGSSKAPGLRSKLASR